MAIISVSLTEFSNFAVSTVSNRISEVEKSVERSKTDYDPRTDLYFRLRERLMRMHAASERWTVLDKMVGQQTHKTKLDHYPGLIKNYKDGWAKRAFAYFPIDFADWTHNDVRIRAGAQIGVGTIGKKHPVRLWFNSQAPGSDRIAVMLGVMHLAKSGNWPSDYEPAVWDVRHDKFYSAPMQQHFDRVLRGLVDDFKDIWQAVT